MAYNYSQLVANVDRVLSSDPRIGISRIAVALQVDRHTLVTALKHIRGVTFVRYRRDRLLEKALSLLNSPTVLTVKQVSFALNFSSPQSFTRFIRENTGRSPRQIMQDRPPQS
ncbi:MAG: AraC family transcriptional regulator [Acidobacteria bacterium]|nr:AraC family transcriptional regulator [Acidobacteriota bacterium]